MARSLRQIPSRVPDETCAKGEGKLHDVVLRPLLASSPEVIALMLFVMLVSAGAKASGGPRGDGSPLTFSIIFTNLAEARACQRQGCFLPALGSNCMLDESISDCLAILCVNGDEDVTDGDGEVCECVAPAASPCDPGSPLSSSCCVDCLGPLKVPVKL